MKLIFVILYILFSIPLLFFLVFTLGETLSGDISGLSHLIQAIPFAALLYLVYRFDSKYFLTPKDKK